MKHLLAALIAIGRVRLVDDSKAIQTMQVDEGPANSSGARRLIDKVAKFSQFGFVSVPPLGSEIIMVRLGGDRAASVAVGSNHQTSRLRNLAPGDAAMHDVRGQAVKLSAAGVEIDCQGLPCTVVNAASVTINSSGAVTINCSTATIGGPLRVTGPITAPAFTVG